MLYMLRDSGSEGAPTSERPSFFALFSVLCVCWYSFENVDCFPLIDLTAGPSEKLCDARKRGSRTQAGASYLGTCA